MVIPNVFLFDWAGPTGCSPETRRPKPRLGVLALTTDRNLVCTGVSTREPDRPRIAGLARARPSERGTR